MYILSKTLDETQQETVKNAVLDSSLLQVIYQEEIDKKVGSKVSSDNPDLSAALHAYRNLYGDLFDQIDSGHRQSKEIEEKHKDALAQAIAPIKSQMEEKKQAEKEALAKPNDYTGYAALADAITQESDSFFSILAIGKMDTSKLILPTAQEIQLAIYSKDDARLTISRANISSALMEGVLASNLENHPFGEQAGKIAFLKQLAESLEIDGHKVNKQKVRNALLRPIKDKIAQYPAFSKVPKDKLDAVLSKVYEAVSRDSVNIPIQAAINAQQRTDDSPIIGRNAVAAAISKQLDDAIRSGKLSIKGNDFSNLLVIQDYLPENAHIEPKSVTSIVESVLKETSISEKDNPFGQKALDATVVKGIHDHVTVMSPNTSTTVPFPDDLKNKNLAGIVKVYLDHNNLENNEKNAEMAIKLYENLGTGNLQAYKDTLANKGAENNKTKNYGILKPLVAMGVAGVAAYAGSESKPVEPAEGQGEGQQNSPKKQSWFKPVLKWLGIAAGIVALVELGASAMGKNSPIVGPMTAKLFKQKTELPANGHQR